MGPIYNNPIFNPMGDYYRSQMQQIAQQPQFPQYPPQQQPMFQQPQYVINQVTSVDEARNSMIDAVSTYLFVDTAANKIYLKKLNNQGRSDFLTFTLDNAAKPDPLNEINKRLKAIEEKIGGVNVQSISNDAGYAESGAADVSANAAPESSVG